MALLAFFRRIRTVVYLMTHPAVPLKLKLLPVIALAYVLSPRDLLFDFRSFGYLDDVLFLTLLLSVFIKKGWQHVLNAEHRKTESIPVEFTVVDPESGSDDEGDNRGDEGSPDTNVRS